MHNFSKAKQNAIDEMLNMNKRATHLNDVPPQNNAPYSPNTSITSTPKTDNSFSNDTLLIIGLILILSQDCSDTRLFLALLYILM